MPKAWVGCPTRRLGNKSIGVTDGIENMKRRDLLLSACGPFLAGVPSWAAEPSAELAKVWRRERGVLLIRHAVTEAGIGDPPGFVLGQCPTQRNLSDAGRQASRLMGQWMRAHGFAPDAVLSSQWCRCQDTARLAFSQFQDWPALNSTFEGQGDLKAQMQAIKERLQTMPSERMEVWVTHQVIMTALVGAYPAMGEGFVVDRRGRLLARAEITA